MEISPHRAAPAAAVHGFASLIVAVAALEIAHLAGLVDASQPLIDQRPLVLTDRRQFLARLLQVCGLCLA